MAILAPLLGHTEQTEEGVYSVCSRISCGHLSDWRLCLSDMNERKATPVEEKDWGNEGYILEDVVSFLKWFNSLAPGKLEWNFRFVIFKQILVIAGCEIALIWM